MRRLTLLRHAKTERDSPTGRDFDRALNHRGRGDAERMGKEIRELGLTFDRALASPARRAIETIEGAGLVSHYDKRLYNATRDDLLGLVRSIEDGVKSLLLVGHNPGFEQLAATFTGREIEEMPTGSLAEIEFPIAHWSEVEAGSGTLTRFVRPKLLV
jgi:phosphohistidine phosphatase